MNTTTQRPTIGRIVHYQQPCAHTTTEAGNPPDQPAFITRAAIVTGIRTVDGIDWLILRVLCDYPGEDFTIDCSPGGYMSEGVSETPAPTSGCWNWPPRA